ncbi:MAG: hypothetical protein ABJF10_07880 [Chthoniobacter sp.]|uniref:hypothetical protein n=1 Tax=Chthoniobacter sp. TaxID=2510640 RepID=UPI0032A62B15
MKLPFPLLFAALLGFVLAACGPSKVKAPDPNPVGQWQWSNDVLGSWHLEIKADGTFQREMTNPLDPKHVRTSGRWILHVSPSGPSWMADRGAEDELSRIAGVDPAKKTVQWSAPGTIVFLYATPRGTELAPGAVWTGTTSTPSKGPPELGIEETHSLRTHTDTTGEVFLDLAGKVFRKSDQADALAALAEESAKIAGGTPERADRQEATPPSPKPEFLTVEPCTGITLDLPGNWQSMDVDSAEKATTTVAAMVGKTRAPKAKSTYRFIPPEDVADINIMVSVQPVIFTAKQLEDSSQIDLDRFAAGFVKGASKALEEKGYHLEPNVTADRAMLGQRAIILCVAHTVDPVGNRRLIRTFCIPTASATIVVECCWDPESGTPWKAIIERACSSLRVAETFAALESPKP